MLIVHQKTCSSFEIFSKIHNETLFVNYPQHTKYCVITINSDEVPRENWPEDWLFMNINREEKLCAINLMEIRNFTMDNSTIANFKVRYYMKNKGDYYAYNDHEWNKIVYNLDYIQDRIRNMEKERIILFAFCCIFSIILVLLFSIYCLIKYKKNENCNHIYEN